VEEVAVARFLHHPLDLVAVAEVERVEMVVQQPEEQERQVKVMLEDQLHLVMAVAVAAELEPLVLMHQMRIKQHLQAMVEQGPHLLLQEHQLHMEVVVVGHHLMVKTVMLQL
jgi:hypothetical protein